MNILHKYMLNSNIIEFTNEHLDINKNFYNIERKPEYFSFDDKGLSYQGTYLFSNKRIQNAIIHDSNNQLFRQTRNSKIPGMKHDIKERGIDIREKPLQIVCTKGENMEDVRVEHLFNGNSFNEALYGAAPDLENRMCAVYFKNANFTLANLIQVGAFLNTLDYQSEPLNDASLAVILKRMMEDAGYMVEIKGIDCFMPGSLAGINKLHDFSTVLDKELSMVPEVDELIKELNVPVDKIWAMPAGDDRESLFESYPIVMNFVRDKGWRFTGRSHIMAFNTERCV